MPREKRIYSSGLGMTAESASAIASTKPSRSRAPTLRTIAFIFEDAPSMGFRSGEYDGKNTRSAPLASI